MIHNMGANFILVISGNLASNKGTVTYNGLTLTVPSDGAIMTLSLASSKGTLTLVFASGKECKD